MNDLGPDWPVAFFDDDYLLIYRPRFTDDRTRAETDFIAGALSVADGAAVLDLACGVGRHAIGMAQRGYQVTGVDFNARYLEIAGADAASAGVRIDWRVADMRTLDFHGQFDAVYSYFTSFGYFSDRENEQVLAHIARSLKPGGRFLLDMMNRDWLVAHPQQRTWTQRDDGALLMEEIELDLRRSRVISRQRLVPPEGAVQVTKSFDLRAYTCTELEALLDRQGMRVLEVWGGPDRSVFTSDSRRLVLLAERGSSPA